MLQQLLRLVQGMVKVIGCGNTLPQGIARIMIEADTGQERNRCVDDTLLPALEVPAPW